MKIGKIPVEVLEKIVLNPINNNVNKRNEIIVRPKTGEDCSAIYLGEELCVLSTDPITGATKDSGYIAVHINCNDAAASGAEPVGILITVLLPENNTEEMFEEIMNGVYRASKELGIEVLGGHTEVTDAVNRPIVSGTVIGKTNNKNFISSGGAKLGQGVIMTKWAGLEGTSIIARENEEELKKIVNASIVDNAICFSSMLSIVKEASIASEYGATAMHDATEGGILGAVWEVADCSGLGVNIYEDKIPLKNETVEICCAYDINPYRLISSGALVITAFEADKVIDKLESEGIKATLIGEITECGKFIVSKNGKTILEQPESDEIYKVNLR